MDFDDMCKLVSENAALRARAEKAETSLIECAKSGFELMEKYQRLESALSRMERVREAAEREVPDKCTCDEAYKGRGLKDPSCRYCDMAELRKALREVE